MASMAAGRERDRRAERFRVGNVLNWDKLRIFHAVAQAGSFTHAGDDLHLSQSAVSRQIGALEDEVGVALFHRHARGLNLTEQGELLYRTVHDVFEKLAMTQAAISDTKTRPSGELRVTTTVGFGSTWLTPRMREFLEFYPEISLSLICDDRELDLSMREAHVGIRFSEPQQPDLVKRRLFTVHNHIYAAPEYLKRHGTPRAIADFADHAIIVYGSEAPPTLRNVNWLIERPEARTWRPPILQVNNIYGLLLAVESGLGIASIPDYMVMDHPQLVQILPDLAGPPFDTFFVYPEELRNTKRVTVFRDFLLSKVRDWAF